MALSFIRQAAAPSPTKSADVATHSEMVRFSGGLPLSRRRVRFEDEKSENSSDGFEEVNVYMDDEEDTKGIVSSVSTRETSPVFISRIRDLALIRHQYPLKWTDRAKIWFGVTYLVFSRVAGYLFLGYALVLLSGVDLQNFTNMRGSIDNFDPNNIILDLLPLPMASLQQYFESAREIVAHNATVLGGSKSQPDTFVVTPPDQTTNERTTNIAQAQAHHSPTNIAYIDWIDRALGWKGVGE